MQKSAKEPPSEADAAASQTKSRSKKAVTPPGRPERSKTTVQREKKQTEALLGQR